MVCTALVGVLWACIAPAPFIWAESAPVVSTILAWAFLLVMLPRLGVHAAAWAQVLRIGVNVALLAPGLGRFPASRAAWRRRRWRGAGSGR